MRNFSKTLISMAAVMAVGSAMAAGAMAADLTATYADDTVSISGVTAGKSQYTLLVVQGTTAEGATEVTYDANESTIKQIDQNDEGVAFTSAVVGTLADGSYKVLVGNNDGTVDSGIFTVSSTPVVPPTPEVEYEVHYMGDVDRSGTVDSGDISYVAYYDAFLYLFGEDCMDAGVERTTEAGDTYYMGDVDRSGTVDSGDISYIAYYDAFLYLFGEDCMDAGVEVNLVKID